MLNLCKTEAIIEARSASVPFLRSSKIVEVAGKGVSPKQRFF
jgi:hypothetical protein